MLICSKLNSFRKCNRSIYFNALISSTKIRRISTSFNLRREEFRKEMSSSNLFNVVTDRFQGVTIKDEEEFNCDVQRFTDKLNYSLSKWICDGVKTVWFYISLKHSIFIPVLTANNFVFHRVNDASGDTLVMCRWLPKDKPNSVPPYAHTMIGVGGIVTNAKNQLLVVYQSYGKYESWKLPGGYVEPHESLPEAVVREVEEETGVKTTFKSCVLFRHTHHANFDCSDLYFITVLEPITEEINEDSEEVIKVRWMPFDEFFDHPRVHELNKIFIRTYLEQRNNSITILKHDGIHPVTKRPYTLYSATLSEHGK